MKKSILIIDSGIGGITTLATVRKNLKNIDIIYFADDTFLPYGNKSVEELAMHLCEVISAFEDQIYAVVLACNTATGVAVEFLRKIFCFPIIGTEPAVAVACRSEGRALVLVTPLEATQSKFLRLILQKPVMVLPQPNLALEIDKTLLCNGRVEDILKNRQLLQIISDVECVLKTQKISKVVLGCTHYVFLKYVGILNKYQLFDGNDGVARRLAMFVDDFGNGKTNIIFGSGDKKKSQIALRLLNELLLNFCF